MSTACRLPILAILSWTTATLALADETSLAEFQARRREIEARYLAAVEAGDDAGKASAIEDLAALQLRLASDPGPEGFGPPGPAAWPSDPFASDAGLGAGGSDLPAGKLFLVPDAAPGSPSGTFPTAIPVFDSGRNVTPEFRAYARTEPAAARLLEGIELALRVLGTWRPTTAGLRHLPFWLAAASATPTYVRIVSGLEPTAPGDRTEPANVAAATLYRAIGNRTMIQFDWGPRGMSPVNTTTHDVISGEFANFRPDGHANLMVYDREELLAGDDAKEAARLVFHEFYYHLSVPEMALRDGTPLAEALNSDYQHAYGDDFGWDADFGGVLRRLGE